MSYFDWMINANYFLTVCAQSWQRVTIPSDGSYNSLKRFPAGNIPWNRFSCVILICFGTTYLPYNRGRCMLFIVYCQQEEDWQFCYYNVEVECVFFPLYGQNEMLRT